MSSFSDMLLSMGIRGFTKFGIKVDSIIDYKISKKLCG